MVTTTLGPPPAAPVNPPFPPIALRYPGYHVARATRREELQAILRHRYIVFAERMGVFPLNSQGFELDPFDIIAEHLYASLDGIVVGCVRLVLNSQGPYPLEMKGANFPDFLPRATTMEGSRFNAEPTADHDVAGDLMQAVFRWSRRHGVTHWVGLNNQRSIRSLQRQGWPAEPCGDPVELAGVPYYPYYMRLAEARRRFASQRADCH